MCFITSVVQIKTKENITDLNVLSSAIKFLLVFSSGSQTTQQLSNVAGARNASGFFMGAFLTEIYHQRAFDEAGLVSSHSSRVALNFISNFATRTME